MRQLPSGTRAADGVSPLVLRCGALTVLRCGRLAAWHSQSDALDDAGSGVATPSAYRACRWFWSCSELRKRCLYICEVRRVQGSAPSCDSARGDGQVFLIYAMAHDDCAPICAESAVAACAELQERLKALYQATGEHAALVQPRVGEPSRWFGFGHEAVQQRLRGAWCGRAAKASVESCARCRPMEWSRSGAVRPSKPSPRAPRQQVDASTATLRRARAPLTRALRRLTDAHTAARARPSSAVRPHDDAAVRHHPPTSCTTTPCATPTHATSAPRPPRRSRACDSVGQEKGGISRTVEYRELCRHNLRRLSVRRSAIHRWGVFSSERLHKGEMVIEYSGQLIRSSVSDAKERRYQRDGWCYMFRIDAETVVDATVKGGKARFINHCCQPNVRASILTLDGQARTALADVLIGWHSPPSHPYPHIVHSFGRVRVAVHVPVDDSSLAHSNGPAPPPLTTQERIIYIALRDIPVGQEITTDYKFALGGDKLSCNCGVPGCFGRMN